MKKDTHGYALKAVKEIRGHDGYGAEANVYHKNKMIGYILDDGWGGGLQIQIPAEHIKEINEKHAGEPQLNEYNGKMYDQTAEDFFNAMLSTALELKDNKKLCRNKICMIMANGKQYSMKGTYDHAKKDEYIKSFERDLGVKVAEVVNERLI